MVIRRYFDCNATTPLSEPARAAWLETANQHWHNPGGLYRQGAAAKALLEECREEVGARLGCEASRIVFTAGATESNNAVCAWAARRFPDRKALVSPIEHPSVRESAKWHFRNRLDVAPCSPAGVVEVPAVRQMLGADRPPALVSMMAASNESGVLLPWEEINLLCREQGILFHCDATQWIGKRPAAGLGACDFVTGSAHKFGGPKGVGFLKIPEDCQLQEQHGGRQEHGHRAGTENLAGIKAMMAAWTEREAAMETCDACGRDAFELQLLDSPLGARMVGREAARLWNTSLLVMPDFPNTRWVARLSDLGFAVSTGAACSTGEATSAMLQAMGFGTAEMKRVLRVSGWWSHQRSDWLDLAEAILTTWREFQSGATVRKKIQL